MMLAFVAPPPEPRLATTADIRLGDYREVLAGVQADLMITSPPYNVGSKSERKDGRRKDGGYDPKSFAAIRDYADNLPEADYQQSQIEFLLWAADHLTLGGVLIYNHKPRKRTKALIHPLRWALRPEVEQHLVLVEEVFWDRGSTHNHDKSQLWAQTERLYVFRRADCNYRFDTRTLPPEFRSDVWRIPLTNKAGGHACPWPYEMCQAMIEAWSRPGDLVCDPHCGSGRAAAVALQLGRRFVGAEILPKYHELAETTAATAPPVPRARPVAPPPRPVALPQPADPAPTPVATKTARARKDRVATAIAAAAAAGVRWRWRGTELIWQGLEQLPQPDQALLEELRPEIEQRLADPAEADPEAVLEQLGIDAEYIADPARAAEVVTQLPPVIGLDTETAPLPEHTPPPAWLATTKSGRRAIDQPRPKDKTALDPRLADIRLLQVYDPGRNTSFVIEWSALTPALLRQLMRRQLVVHNALFDLQMLLAQGVEPLGVIDTVQLAAITLGPGERSREGEPQRIGLKHVAQEVLDLELPKDLQTSDWSALSLSDAQLAYAAADPAVAYRAGRAMRQQLSERELPAFRLANAAIPVIARMAMRGLPFDPATHAATIRTWELAYAEQRELFHQQTGLEVPVGAPAIRAWLNTRLSPEAQDTWPRTDTGLLKTGADEIKRLAQDYPEVLALLEVQRREKRLSTFGTVLLDRVSTVTARLHGDYALPTVTGRLTCRKPNLQQLPSDARTAVRAGPGKVLLSADFGQIELRILAERAGEQAMRAAFATGQDIHTTTGARFTTDIWTRDEKDPVRVLARSKAKAVNYGLPYGMGTETLRRKAWKDYDLDLSFNEIVLIRDAWFDTYPAIKPYQIEQYSHRFDAVWSVAGRPRCACWMPETEDGSPRELWYTYCCNFGVQASASDLLLDAMARVDAALPGTMIASVHDELLLEVPEKQAEAAAATLTDQMIAAFVHWFPEAPITGVVEVKTVLDWSAAK